MNQASKIGFFVSVRVALFAAVTFIIHVHSWSTLSAGSIESANEGKPHLHGRYNYLRDNACYNSGFRYQPTTWNETFIHQTPARIFLHRAWTPAVNSSFPLTLVTHLTLSRLYQLEAQCEAWEGNFAAVVYMAIQPESNTNEGRWWLDSNSRAKVREAAGQLQEMHSRMEARQGCRLTMLLMWEAISTTNLTLLYPYNTLRNYAIMQAQTPLVSMIDVDLVPSYSLNEEMKDPVKVQRLLDLCANKTVVVLPAMELVPKEMESGADKSELEQAQLVELQQKCAETVKLGKQQVVDMYKAGGIRQFYADRFNVGHNATNYDQWLVSNDFYSITYEWEYEPWFIVDRRQSLWYDVRYRAWFFDKALQLGSLWWKEQFKIVAHPDVFLVHRPHPKPAVLSDREAFDIILRWMKPRAGLAVLQMMSRRYKPRIDHSMVKCLAKLPWWQVPHSQKDYWDQYVITYGEPVLPDWV